MSYAHVSHIITSVKITFKNKTQLYRGCAKSMQKQRNKSWVNVILKYKGAKKGRKSKVCYITTCNCHTQSLFADNSYNMP